MELSLSVYAEHRGCSLAAVQRAISSGRIKVARTEKHGKMTYSFVDSEVADAEWLKNTDSNQKRTATRGEMAAARSATRKAAKEHAPASKTEGTGKAAVETDIDNLSLDIEYGEYLKNRSPDFTGQVLAPIRTMVKAVFDNIPVDFRAAALSELIALLCSEFTCKIIDEIGPQGSGGKDE